MSSHASPLLPPQIAAAPVAPAPAPVAMEPARTADLPGLAGLGLALLALALLAAGDPYLSALPPAVLATLVGIRQARRGSNRPASMLALYLGLGALMFWLVLEGLLGLVFGFDVLMLPQFSVPK